MTVAVHSPVLWRLQTATGSVAYCSQRIYPARLPQDPQLPAMTYQVISAPREHAMGSDPGHVHARVQVDIYDKTYLGTVSGGKWVREALSRWGGTASGVIVFQSFLDNEIDAYEQTLEGADRRVWRRTLDFIIHYQE